jgi:uncharacterized protein YbaP (TraB family)
MATAVADQGAAMTVDSTFDPEPVLDVAVRRRAEAEYREMPGLKLTPQQASRLWHLDAAATARLLQSMVDAGVLCRARDGAYVSR